MLVASTYENLIKSIRETLIERLHLDFTRVVNAASVRGADLYKVINEFEVTSYSLNDSFIIFEVVENSDKSNIVLHEHNDTDSSIVYYDYKLKVYGNSCHEMCQKILVLFKNEVILQDLYDKGIYVRETESLSMVHEFMNNTVWPRKDITIHCQIRYNFTDEITESVIIDFPPDALKVLDIKI